MAKRIGDGVARMVIEAIEGLDVPRSVKDGIEWEAAPGLAPAPDRKLNLIYMIGIGLPIPGTLDRLMTFDSLRDDSPDEVTRIVRRLYADVQAQLDEMLGVPLQERNRSAGGLIIT